VRRPLLWSAGELGGNRVGDGQARFSEAEMVIIDRN
jgi:hypothetical protein